MQQQQYLSYSSIAVTDFSILLRARLTMCAVLIHHDSCGRDVLLLAAGAGNCAPLKQQALFKD